MIKITENSIEQMAMEYLEDLGYVCFFGPDISPKAIPSSNSSQREENIVDADNPDLLRMGYDEVILETRLRSAIERLNKDITPAIVDEAVLKIKKYDSPDILVNNEKFHKYLTEYVQVDYSKDGENRTFDVKLVDFENPGNNEFIAVNQFKIIENRENRRPDIVLFINGLPMVVIELKNPDTECADLQSAFRQMKTYKKLIPTIFQYNELLVIADGLYAKAGTITSEWERFMPWKTIDGETTVGKGKPEMKTLFYGMLNKDVLIDMIHHFIVFEKTREHTLKKAAAYHQYHAVNKAIASTLRAAGYSAPSSGSSQREESHYRGGYYFSGLIDKARDLRKNQTEAEKFLWEILRNKQLKDMKFRRQHQIGDYVVDFYCNKAKLIIELDGTGHDSEQQKKHDSKRDKQLESLGNKVIRFKNEEVLNNIEQVLQVITNHLSLWERPGEDQVGQRVGKANHLSLWERPGEGHADRRAGVVWHTQGSGKSLSMVFYTGKIVQMLNNPTIVMLTDRNDLDDQLFGTFGDCSGILRQKPVQASDRMDLREKLKVASGGIVFTTIQKFMPDEKGGDFPMLSERSNIVVIADEAHRSQYDFIDGLAKHMRDALPNASYMGFTGTPIEKRDKNTKAVFGEYIHIYDIEQAVNDGSTVRIYYESRVAKIELKSSEKPKVDPKFEEVTEGEEVFSKEKLKSKWGRMEALVGAKERIEQITKDFIAHVEERFEAFEGKAMFVCMSRRICVDVYNEIARLRPQWCDDEDEKGIVKVIMTGSASDPVEWQKHVRTKDRRKKLADRMKNSADGLKIAIVRDMWLTGFDAPCLSTMYIDKPMQGHGLMQAIARVNRVFKDKKGGMIVDYLGLADHLKEALNVYTEGDRKNIKLDTQEAIYAMMKEFETVCDMFYGSDYEKWINAKGTEAQTEARKEGSDYILEKQKDEDFRAHVLQLSQAYALVPTSEEAHKIRDAVGYFQGVRLNLRKLSASEGKDREMLDTAVKQIVSDAVSAGEVVDIFSAAGIKKPDISIFSDEFLEDVRKMKHKSLALELLKRILNDEIKKYKRTNLIKSRLFSEMLEDTVGKLKKKALTSIEVIEALIELAKDIRKAHKRGEDLGLNGDEEAFYDALIQNEAAVKEMTDDTLKEIAKELLTKLKANRQVDWDKREDAKARMRVMVKALLRKYDYPPDAQPAAVKIVLEQAALLNDVWAVA